jgi:hypothetical protein
VDLGAGGIDDLEGLLDVRPRVCVDLLVREHGPFGGAAGRVADARRVVADDEHADMALPLEGGHPLQRDRAAHVDVRRGDVDAELDTQRAAERELPLERSPRQHVDGVANQLEKRGHGSRS